MQNEVEKRVIAETETGRENTVRNFPGQIHFPVYSEPLRPYVIVALFILAIIATLLVKWVL